jgi:hypothetical protein
MAAMPDNDGRRALNQSLGCLAVIPGTLIGFAGLMDYAGPTGWRGFAELVGWLAICAGASVLVASLFARAWCAEIAGVGALLAAIAVGCWFTWFPSYLGSPLPPMSVKLAFTMTLQVIGVFAVLGGAAYLIFLRWREND